uniref:Uncharacterized protein n=1 Tax=Panagrellus redivivus TaxID=6233 RepID=A0A7E4VWU1_PANRE
MAGRFATLKRRSFRVIPAVITFQFRQNVLIKTPTEFLEVSTIHKALYDNDSHVLAIPMLRLFYKSVTHLACNSIIVKFML